MSRFDRLRAALIELGSDYDDAAELADNIVAHCRREPKIGNAMLRWLDDRRLPVPAGSPAR